MEIENNELLPITNHYTLSITVDEETTINLNGNNRNHSFTHGFDTENMRDFARLYYGKQWSEDTVKLFNKIEEKYLTRGAVRHHSSAYALYIKGLGQYLFENTLPREIRSILNNLPKDSVLILDLDDAASMVPWELIHTDHNFLCLDHVLSRTKPDNVQRTTPTGKAVPLLLIADPTGDLYGSQIEANYIIGQVRGSNFQVSRYGSEITKKRYFDLLKSGAYEIIHYSGHSESSNEPGKSHHKFMDGELLGYEIERLKGHNMPKLVFSNSCQSAESNLEHDDAGNTSLAGSYLTAGVSSSIAAIWLVSDVGAAQFSSDFYRFMLFGSTVGEALLRSRRSAFKRWGLQDFIWGSYIFYGDPYVRFF
ncbi:CHAT domain-containing protein [Thermoproteota archaeon]